MTDVRSQRLVSYRIPDLASHVVWTTPPGMVTLLKWVVAANQTNPDSTLAVWLYDGALSVMVLNKAIAQNEVVHLECWLALNPGDQIVVAATVADLDIWLSGAVLLGGPPVPPQPPTVVLGNEQLVPLGGDTIKI